MRSAGDGCSEDWIGNRSGIKVAQGRDTTVISISDVVELGIEGAMEFALECAWKDADSVIFSFHIDCVDPGFSPGTGTPEPGGLLVGDSRPYASVAIQDHGHGFLR